MWRTKKYIILLLSSFFSTFLAAQNDSAFNGKTLASFSLVNSTDARATFINHSITPLTLFFFISPECPLCRDYSTVMNHISQVYGEQVTVYGIVPGKAYTTAEVNAFAKKYNLRFAVLIDGQQQLSAYMHASVTPEAILLNDQYQLAYKGAIDNLLEGLGKRRLKATASYLEDAIKQTLNRQVVAIKRTKATGCKINNY